MENLELLPTLKRLDLRSNHIRTLDNLTALSHLEELLASDNFISVIGPSVASLQSLRILDLADNELSDAAALLEILSQLPSLTELKLQGNPVVLEERFLESLLVACPALRRLDGEPIPTGSGSDSDSDREKHAGPCSTNQAAASASHPRTTNYDAMVEDLSAINGESAGRAGIGVGFATVTVTPFESVEMVTTRSPKSPAFRSSSEDVEEAEKKSKGATLAAGAEASSHVRSLRSSIQTRAALLQKERDAWEEHTSHVRAMQLPNISSDDVKELPYSAYTILRALTVAHSVSLPTQ